MAAFREDEVMEAGQDGQQVARLDWLLMKDGPIALFRKGVVLADAVAWLERHGYAIAQADCGDCQTEQEVLWAIGQSLGFPRYPTPNLNGFDDDCWHLAVPDGGGTAVVLRRFEQVAERFPEFARLVLDVFARTAWNNLLYGRRLVCLVQSENPGIQFGRVGVKEPSWNSREWFRASRE